MRKRAFVAELTQGFEALADGRHKAFMCSKLNQRMAAEGLLAEEVNDMGSLDRVKAISPNPLPEDSRKRVLRVRRPGLC